MADWEEIKKKHDLLLDEFRAKSSTIRAIYTEDVQRHTAQLHLVEAVKARQRESENRRNSQRLIKLNEHSRLQSKEAYEGLQAAEENLKRLGLDEQSIDQQKQYVVPPQQSAIQQFKFVAPQTANEVFDDTASGKASVYSRKSRKGASVNSNNVAITHPLVGGVSSLLRNVNAKDGQLAIPTDLYVPQNAFHVRAKLCPPTAMYPTVSPIVDAATIDSDDEEAPLEIDIDDLERGAAYMEDIHKSKQDHDTTMKERQVRHHRLRSEQARSRSEISEKKELELLLRKAKFINGPDKQQVITNRMHRISSNRDQKAQSSLSIATNCYRSEMAGIELNKGAIEARSHRRCTNSDFGLIRAEKRQQETNFKGEKHASVVSFCSELVNSILGLVNLVVDKSMHQTRDGSWQYKRAVFGVTEWNTVRSSALRFKMLTTQVLNADEHVENKRNVQPEEQQQQRQISQMKDAEINIDKAVVVSDCKFVMDLVDKSSEGRKVVQRKISHEGGASIVFISGDSTLSGVTLLDQLAPAFVNTCIPNRYLILTPRLLHHLFFEKKRVILDDALYALCMQRSHLQLESQKNQQQSGKTTRKDGKGKDGLPSVPSLQLNELNVRIVSLQAERNSLITEATETISKIEDTETLGGLLSSLLNMRREAQHEEAEDYTEDEGLTETPLTIDLICRHPSLKYSKLFLVGFPTTQGFGRSFESGLCDEESSRSVCHIILGCTKTSRLQRLNERELFWKPNGPAPVTTVEDVAKKRKPARLEQTQPPSREATAPREIISHPLLSPLDSRSIMKTIDAKQVMDGPPPTPNPLEYTFSPFLTQFSVSHQSTGSIFVRTMSWRDELKDDEDEVKWLEEFLCSADECSSMDGKVGQSIATQHLTLNDFADSMFANIKLSRKLPGKEAPTCEPHILNSVKERLCDAILAELPNICNTEVNYPATQITSLKDEQPALSKWLAKLRKSYAISFSILQSYSQSLFAHFSDAQLCYPEHVVSDPYGTFERLRKCDEQRKLDSKLIQQYYVTFAELIEKTKADWIDEFENLRKIVNGQMEDSDISILEEIFLSSPFHTLELLTTRIHQVAKAWVNRLFETFTQNRHLENSRPPTVGEMLAIINPETEQVVDPVVDNTIPTLFQMICVKSILKHKDCGKLSMTAVEGQLSFLKTLSNLAPAFIPTSVCKLQYSTHTPISWENLASHIAVGRTSEGIPYANPLQLRKLGLSLKGRTKLTWNEFNQLDWWFGDAARYSLNLILNDNESLNVPELFHFVCSDLSKNNSFLIQKWFELISCHLGNSSDTPLSNELIAKYFPSGTFKQVDVETAEFLSTGSCSPKGATSFSTLLSTNFGKYMIQKAPIAHL